MKIVLFLFVFFLSSFQCLFSQTKDKSNIDYTYRIGPKGADTALCKIYVFRENDELNDLYFGFVSEEYYGMFAKVFSGQAYQINCGGTGKKTFYFQTIVSGKQAVDLNLNADSIYYIKLTVSGTRQNPEIAVSQLTKSVGEDYLKSFSGKIHVRYSTIPFQFSYYVSDQFRTESDISVRMADSLDLNFSKTQHASFIRPLQFDGWMKVLGMTSLLYTSRTISLTYSEALTFFFKGKLKVSNEDEFKELINQKIINKNIKSKGARYKNYQSEILYVNDHPTGNYNALIYMRYEDHEAANKGINPYLVIQDLYRIISWRNNKGKLEWMVFAVSERGTENELHSKEELVNRYREFDRSIEIHNNTK